MISSKFSKSPRQIAQLGSNGFESLGRASSYFSQRIWSIIPSAVATWFGFGGTTYGMIHRSKGKQHKTSKNTSAGIRRKNVCMRNSVNARVSTGLAQSRVMDNQY